MSKQPLTSFWLLGWACALAISWLLPNHYPPWASFHADAWAAAILALASFAVIVRVKASAQWHQSAVLVAVLACIPWLQYSAGLISFAGQAWISTAYLLGLLLALLTGQRWERACPDQLATGLFLAVALASVVSVNIQLQTWLGVVPAGFFDLWTMGLAGDRPYANIGQPNQLATLLLWGLLACAWAYIAQKIRPAFALLLAAYLLIGIALTQSRTAWLGLTFLVLATWVWKRHWGSKWVPWSVTALYAFFWIAPFLLRELTDVLLLGAESAYARAQIQGELRPLAWRLFIDAALSRPWFGYGWSEVGHAQLAVAKDFPGTGITFQHSHNLFLDLILWLGIPLGMLVAAALVWWAVIKLRAVKNAKDAILLMFLGVVGIHAMLELPLHYAYFLLPTGMVMGVLNARQNSVMWHTPRWTLVVLWLAGAVLFSIIVRDYLRVEASIQTVRFEKARIGALPEGQPPDVVVLTQLREQINQMRYQPKPGMSSLELDWMIRVSNAYPGLASVYKAAKALALNGRPQEAGLWLAKICKITDRDACELAKRAWAQDSQSDSKIAAVPWPE